MEDTLSKKVALKNMGLLALGIGLFPMVACDNSENAGSSTVKGTGPLLPFYIPPQVNPLEPGILGINVRTIVRCAQTNHQFFCVKMAVAPKHMGPLHIFTKI